MTEIHGTPGVLRWGVCDANEDAFQKMVAAFGYTKGESEMNPAQTEQVNAAAMEAAEAFVGEFGLTGLEIESDWDSAAYTVDNLGWPDEAWPIYQARLKDEILRLQRELEASTAVEEIGDGFYEATDGTVICVPTPGVKGFNVICTNPAKSASIEACWFSYADWTEEDALTMFATEYGLELTEVAVDKED